MILRDHIDISMTMAWRSQWSPLSKIRGVSLDRTIRLQGTIFSTVNKYLFQGSSAVKRISHFVRAGTLSCDSPIQILDPHHPWLQRHQDSYFAFYEGNVDIFRSSIGVLVQSTRSDATNARKHGKLGKRGIKCNKLAMAVFIVFILQSHYPSGRTWANILSFDYASQV